MAQLNRIFGAAKSDAKRQTVSCRWNSANKARNEEREKMNTYITASAKPEYPVIYRNPPFTKIVANFNTLDYLRLTTIFGISVTVGYLSGPTHISYRVNSSIIHGYYLNNVGFGFHFTGIKPGIRGPSMVTGGLIRVMGGFMYAYQNFAGCLMGFFPNDGEVARYKKQFPPFPNFSI